MQGPVVAVITERHAGGSWSLTSKGKEKISLLMNMLASLRGVRGIGHHQCGTEDTGGHQC